MRKLASFQIVSSLTPIPGADKIELAKVLGWNVVVKKGDFKEGDVCIYFEIDSILPDMEIFSFMKDRHMRVRTIRLRGQISQGLAMPPEAIGFQGFGPEDVDKDVTELLGVKKYEPEIPACLAGIVKGNFPSFIPKTDETRVQVLQKVLDKYGAEECYVTEKVDGSSCTVYLRDGEFGVCSRNIDLVRDENNTFWKMAIAMNLEGVMRRYGKNIALQGELIGEGVQGNKYGLSGHRLLFFNVFDIDKCEYLDLFDMLATFEDLEIGIHERVPLLSSNYRPGNDIDFLVKESIASSRINHDIPREGIVIRPIVERLDLLLSKERFNNGRVSFKVINPEFLLKFGE